MNWKKNTLLVLSFAILLPLITTFAGNTNFQQRWWQRKKAKTPPAELTTLEQAGGYALEIRFEAGRRHNHPLMAFWIEDTSGRYIQSLYVAQSIAEGYFRHGDPSSGRWEPGPLRRPAALPYWGHKRGIKESDGYYLPSKDNPMPDAVTGATPKADFILSTRTRHKEPQIFNLMMEINQSWDWNQHWHNNKYPDDQNYKTSSQPALVYQVTIDVNNPQEKYILQPVGHSHWSGANGDLYDDLSTITTALDIAKEVSIVLKQE